MRQPTESSILPSQGSRSTRRQGVPPFTTCLFKSLFHHGVVGARRTGPDHERVGHLQAVDLHSQAGAGGDSAIDLLACGGAGQRSKQACVAQAGRCCAWLAEVLNAHPCSCKLQASRAAGYSGASSALAVRQHRRRRRHRRTSSALGSASSPPPNRACTARRQRHDRAPPAAGSRREGCREGCAGRAGCEVVLAGLEALGALLPTQPISPARWLLRAVRAGGRRLRDAAILSPKASTEALVLVCAPARCR